MTKQRFLFAISALQLFALVLLVQTWFTLSMVIDEKTLELGAFDGASAFGVSMPLSLLSLSALLVAFISNGFGLVSALAVTSIANLTNLALVTPMLVSQDLSALDGQLDRLTGIANTHGLEDLAVQQSAAPIAWMVVTLGCAVVAFSALKYVGTWKSARFDKVETAKKPRRDSSVSPIDLWDNQRD